MKPYAWQSWAQPAYPDLFEWHAGRCGACGYADRLQQDHDHDTGLIRGLLCPSCNQLENNMSPFMLAWSAGDNTAQALGIREVYRSPWGGHIVLSPQSELNFYTDDERTAWWNSLDPAEPWPTTVPVTEASAARRSGLFDVQRGSGPVAEALDGIFR